MSDTESGRPRRAFDSAEGDDSDAVDADDTQVRRPSRAWAPLEGEDADVAAVTTPIPPPAPALPEALQPPEAGRRFSAEAPTQDWVEVAPRRSAASVSSPIPDPNEPSEDPTGEPADGADNPPAGTGRRRRALIIGAIAALLVLGLVIWLAVQRPSGSATPPPGPTEQSTSAAPSVPVLDPAALLGAADLTGLRKGLTWSDAPSPTGPAPQPVCIELATLGGPAPQSEADKTFTGSASGGSLTQVSLAMDDVSAATTAFDTLVGSVARCPGALIVAAYEVTSLADGGTGVTVAQPDGVQHTLLLTRTGRVLNIVDASVKAAAPLSINALADAVGTSLTKQCGAAGGTCPGNPRASAVAPPTSDPAGWLAWVDLPQVNPGVGTWTANEPQQPKLVGSQCEAVNLNQLPGAKSTLHRTYLLTDDPKAPQAFGIDEAVYVMDSASAAKSMVSRLKKNFGGCAARTRTATVTDNGVTAVDGEGDELTGTGYLVTQRISDSRTVTFRVGVAAIGTRVVYLLANPSATFDFSPEAWDAVVARAAQRATQFA